MQKLLALYLPENLQLLPQLLSLRLLLLLLLPLLLLFLFLVFHPFR
jgi:hypothetical protein